MMMTSTSAELEIACFTHMARGAATRVEQEQEGQSCLRTAPTLDAQAPIAGRVLEPSVRQSRHFVRRHRLASRIAPPGRWPRLHHLPGVQAGVESGLLNKRMAQRRFATRRGCSRTSQPPASGAGQKGRPRNDSCGPHPDAQRHG